MSFWYGGGSLDDWSGLVEDDTWVVDLEAPTRKASMALVEVRKCSKDHGTGVGWVMCLRGASESNASLETTDSGADRLTKRLSSVREEDFGQKKPLFSYLILDRTWFNSMAGYCSQMVHRSRVEGGETRDQHAQIQAYVGVCAV